MNLKLKKYQLDQKYKQSQSNDIVKENKSILNLLKEKDEFIEK